MDIPGTKPVANVASGLQAVSDNAGQAAAPSLTVTAVKPVVETVQKGLTETQRAAPQSASVRLAAIAAQLQDFLRSSQRDIEFSVDADTKANIIIVRDSNTGDIIRQIPTEEALRIMKNLDAGLGALVDQRA